MQALLSVSDKTGLAEFAKGLVRLGVTHRRAVTPPRAVTQRRGATRPLGAMHHPAQTRRRGVSHGRVPLPRRVAPHRAPQAHRCARATGCRST